MYKLDFARRMSLLAFAAVFSVFTATAAVASPCEDLAKASFPDAKITATTVVAADKTIGLPGIPFTITAPKTFCRVQVTLTPTADSAILAEVWLPDADAWNEKFLGSGNGGFGGSVAGPMLDMRMALSHGYATAGDDLGHETPFPKIDASWAIGHPEKLIDFAYRADHVTAVFAKAIIAAYYGRAPKLSYFRGCSNGGHEAMMEAIRYPEDYDGIIAGAPANSWTHLMADFVWNERALSKTPQSRIPDTKLALVQNAVLAKCDEKDGVKDGIINDPLTCHFDPRPLLCKSGNGPNCLSRAEFDALASIYKGPIDPKTHESIYPGFPPGGEGLPKNWTSWITGPDAAQAQFANQFFGSAVKGDPNWDFRTFDFHSDVALADKTVGPVINSNNPDLSAFEAHGGKLILFQGWDDAAVTALGTIQYYRAVEAKMGLAKTQNFARLFLAPGMMHCGDGPGPNNLDCITALEQWREGGIAPEKVAAAHYDNMLAVLAGMQAANPTATRPICAYPAVAHWTGTGSADDAANYVCQAPATAHK
ncbi:MAG TPA: tannase/feruloyl esterase family alpha/beta hydrolase [Rhizomicrobium sp.]|jgi:feruloyl esterase